MNTTRNAKPAAGESPTDSASAAAGENGALPADAAAASVVRPGICLEGELEGRGTLIVEGRVKGRIQTRGDVIVAPGGQVEAVIVARNITIQGRVNGNIEAREAVEIQQEGVLIGDCRSRTIQIREGARFEGRSDIL